MDLKADTLDNFLADNCIGEIPNAKEVFLYHYTGADAAAAIIRDGAFCSNSDGMKDEHCFSLGRKFMKAHPCSLANGLNWNKLCSNTDKSVRSWIFSLCRNGNDMQMIQSYACGKPGGPAQLQFSFCDLYEDVHNEMSTDLSTLEQKPQASKCYHFLLPCLYFPSQEQYVLELEQFLFGEYLTSLVEQQSELCPKEFAFACKYIFLAMIKDDKYKGEQEYRLVKITFDGCDAKSQPFGIECRPKLEPLPFSCPFCKSVESH